MTAPTIWLDVPGYEGRYQASSDGQIKAVERRYLNKNGARRRTPEKILSGAHSGRRYLNVVLFKDADTPVTWKVHQVIARTFHGPRPFPDAEIRHLNGDARDNRASNLRWGTRAENAQDTLRHGNHAQARKTHCKSGHEFTAENTENYVTPDGQPMRRCKTCRLRWRQDEAARNRARRSVA